VIRTDRCKDIAFIRSRFRSISGPVVFRRPNVGPSIRSNITCPFISGKWRQWLPKCFRIQSFRL